MSVTTTTRPNRVIVGSADGETRIQVPGMRYQVYESWVESLPESTPVRMAYDGRSMELMVKGRKHDNYRELLGEIVRAITQELAIPMSSNGETTWIRPEIERGLEADQSYYFQRFATGLKLQRFPITPLQVGQENRPFLRGPRFPHDLAAVHRLTLAGWFSGRAIGQQVVGGE